MLLPCQSAELPVGGGAGVEDVLFGREQRQAVGIKVNRSLVHDAQNFPERSASFRHWSRWRSGLGVSAGKEKKKKKHTQPQRNAKLLTVEGGKSTLGMQVHVERL